MDSDFLDGELNSHHPHQVNRDILKEINHDNHDNSDYDPNYRFLNLNNNTNNNHHTDSSNNNE